MSSHRVRFGFWMGPFAAGVMLLWGGIAAIPIVLHLLRRRRNRTLHWGAMRFLQAAVAQRAKRFELWRLLLLLLRIAAVLIIAAALARPHLHGSATAVGRERPGRLRIFVFDTSLSMQARVNDRQLLDAIGLSGSDVRRFDVAQMVAKSLLDGAEPGDAVGIVTAGETTMIRVAAPSYQWDDALETIDDLQVGDGTCDLDSAWGMSELVIRDARAEGWSGTIDVIYLSDQQRLTWDQRLPASPSGDTEPGEVRYWAVDCSGQSTMPNVVTDSLARETNGASIGDTLRLLSRILNTDASIDSPPGTISFSVDQRVDRTGSMESIAAGESKTLSWDARLSSGSHLLEVETRVDDAIARDNWAGAIVTARERLTVAVLAPRLATAKFLELALTAGNTRGIDVRVLPQADLTRLELGQYDVWVLCDPSPLRNEQADRVAKHVAAGGGVVWWLGPNWVDAAGWQMTATLDSQFAGTIIGSRDESAPLSAADWLARRVVTPSEPTVDPQAYRSPIVAPFEPFPDAGLTTLPVFRHWALELGQQWTTAISVNSAERPREPLIATWEGAAGLGRQTIIATPPGPGDTADPWNAMIAWPVFVPLARQVVTWCSSAANEPLAIVVGEPLSGHDREDQIGEALLDPAGNRLDINITRRAGRNVWWRSGKATLIGPYTWSGGKADGRAAIVANANAAESRLDQIDVPTPFQRLSPAELATIDDVSDATGRRPENASQASSGSARQTNGGTGGEISWWLLIVALGLLLAESSVVRFLEARY